MAKLTEYLRRFFGSSNSSRMEQKGLQHPNGVDTTSPSSGTAHLVDIKYVDYVYNEGSHIWEYLDTTSDVLAEAVTPFGSVVSSGDWQDYCFVIVRKFPARRAPGEVIVFKIVIKSAHLLQACKHVLGYISGLSWTNDPLEVR